MPKSSPPDCILVFIDYFGGNYPQKITFDVFERAMKDILQLPLSTIVQYIHHELDQGYIYHAAFQGNQDDY